MAGGGGQQQGGQSDNSYAIIWGVAAVFAVLGIIWYTLKDYIVHIYLAIKSYELGFINSIAKILHLNTDSLDKLQSTIAYIQLNPANIQFEELLKIGGEVGSWLRIPLVLLLLALAVIVYTSNTTRIYKRTYSMKDLAKLEKTNWPQILPVVDLDLNKTDIDTGPWAMAMTPMQFCKKYRLLEEVRAERREGMLRKDWDRLDVVLKRGEANKIFALQLGPVWQGVNKLPPHAKALFAAFAARINAEGSEAEKIYTQLSISASDKGRLNLTGVDDLIKKYINTKQVQRIVTTHAYVVTVMASMLEGAREDGVQASADFLWLKPIDRRLWYTLNTVGRQTPFIEVAGVFAHWIAEKEAGRKLMVPMVEEATKAVELALKEIVYRPDET